MSTLYPPKPGKKLAKLLQRARKQLARMDQADERGGVATPQRCPFDLHLRTVLSALECGVEMGNWNIIAEGFAMLQDAELRFRTEHPDLSSVSLRE